MKDARGRGASSSSPPVSSRPVVSLTDFTTANEVGSVELPRTGRIIKIRVMDAPDGTGLAIDVREFMLDEFWRRTARLRLERR
jgi:hypothetical protein